MDDERAFVGQPQAEGLLRHTLKHAPGINIRTLEQVVILAIEIAREGREGRKIGTIFTVGDHERVLEHSTALILDPLLGHPPERKRVDVPDMRETVKELAQLDGAFVVTNDGVFVSACRYISATADGIRLPLGLGSRHMAAASITRDTDAMAVVVSETSVVRVFDDGEIVSEIIPEVWMLSRHALHLSGRYSMRSAGGVTVASKED